MHYPFLIELPRLLARPALDLVRILILECMLMYCCRVFNGWFTTRSRSSWVFQRLEELLRQLSRSELVVRLIPKCNFDSSGTCSFWGVVLWFLKLAGRNPYIRSVVLILERYTKHSHAFCSSYNASMNHIYCAFKSCLKHIPNFLISTISRSRKMSC